MRTLVSTTLVCIFSFSFLLSAMSQDEEIQSIVMSKTCLKSMPCQHEVTVIFKDGSKEQSTLYVTEIYKRYWDFLDEVSQNHLKMEPAVYRQINFK